ncbi:OmpH family outer membrane protein [Sphingosinicella terrae]|jgi:outer membrane protein|uniref:OmpH family outer membrane protein n=1 Tax=Sphingosinicella terrae TaxID=2172047 RepID=UPI000E0CF71F|nr:OmpH family outer membrane protein [Sphingosinicella terrae]
MNKLTFGAAVAALALIAPVAAQAQNIPPAIVAIVDRDRIAQSCTQCVAAQQQLQAQVTQFQQRAQQLSTPLQTEEQAIETALRALPQGGQPDAALQQRIQTFRTNQQAAATELGPRQEQLRRNQSFVVQQILERMDPLVGQVVRQRGANLAVDVSTTLAHNPALDITDSVLQLMNANSTAFNVNAPPPQQQPAQQPAQQQQQRPQGR